jgi:hypothetical protein
MDLANLKAKNVGVYTDKNLSQLAPMKAVLDSLHKSGLNFSVYDDVRVEPTDVRYVNLPLSFSSSHWHPHTIALQLHQGFRVRQEEQLRRFFGRRRRIGHGHLQGGQLVRE